MPSLNKSLEVLRRLLRPETRRQAYAERDNYVCTIMQEAVDAMARYQTRLSIPDRDIAVLGYLARNPRAHIIADENVCNAFDSAERALKEAEKRRLMQCLQEL